MVDLDKSIEMTEVQSNCRVALRNDSYKLHKILPNKVRDQNNHVHVCCNKVLALFVGSAVFSARFWQLSLR